LGIVPVLPSRYAVSSTASGPLSIFLFRPARCSGRGRWLTLRLSRRGGRLFRLARWRGLLLVILGLAVRLPTRQLVGLQLLARRLRPRRRLGLLPGLIAHPLRHLRVGREDHEHLAPLHPRRLLHDGHVLQVLVH